MPPADSGNHDHHDHRHAPGHGHASTAATAGTFWFALALTAGFGVVEAVGGWLAGSLALISDAGHMATDAAGLLIALIAQAFAQRPPSQQASYGYARAEVLAAFINALAMLVLVVWIAVEAAQRMFAPQPVAAPMVMLVAAIGLCVNIAVAWILSRSGGGLNTRGALLHVMGDLLGSVAALLAGAIIHFTGWLPIDPLLSLVVVLLILRSTWTLLRQSTGVLMEQVPAHLSYEAIGVALAAQAGVTEVHDLHVWNMGADRVALSAHVTIKDGSSWLRTLASAQQMLARDFGIHHVTLQPAWPAPLPDRRVIPVAPVGEGTPERHLH